MSVGERIKELRLNKGMTMEEFGELIGGVKKSSVNNWEKGENIPNKERLKKIAGIGGKSVTEFFGDSLTDNRYKSFGVRVKVIRKSLGLTMKEFGIRMGNPVASDSIVSRWEKGKSFPNNERLKRIAEIGDISVEELLYGKQGKITTNNITATQQGNKYTIIIKEGEQDRWFTVDKDTARELISKLGSVLNG